MAIFPSKRIPHYFKSLEGGATGGVVIDNGPGIIFSEFDSRGTKGIHRRAPGGVDKWRGEFRQLWHILADVIALGVKALDLQNGIENPEIRRSVGPAIRRCMGTRCTRRFQALCHQRALGFNRIWKYLGFRVSLGMGNFPLWPLEV